MLTCTTYTIWLLPWVREPVLLYTPTPYRGGPPSPHAPNPYHLLYTLKIFMFNKVLSLRGVGAGEPGIGG